MSFWETLVTIAGLAAITLLTRSFFMLPRRELPLPRALQQGLRYAPLAALVAIVVPEIVLPDGRWIATWQDPRLGAAAAATVVYFWRRNILATIVSGTAVMLLLRLGLGWGGAP